MKTTTIRTFLLSAFLLAFALALAGRGEAGSDKRKIDALIRKYYQGQKFNGVVLVAHQGKVLYKQAWGMADFRRGRRLQASSAFNLASVSKAFTAMAVMIARQRGLLSYDDDAARYLPGLPYKGVTIRHMLHHTSGLPDYIELADKYWDWTKPVTNRDIPGLLQHARSLRFKPGEQYEYSNTGYALLASIVERATGQTYAQFLQRQIFEPLRMDGSFVYSEAEDRRHVGSRAYGFHRAQGKYVLDDVGYLDPVVGDGSVFSSAEDLLKWDQALYTEKLVSAAALAEAFRPGVLNSGKQTTYGFGWELDPAGHSVSHGGSWAGFRSSLTRLLGSKDTIIILDNTSDEVDEIDQAIQSALEAGDEQG